MTQPRTTAPAAPAPREPGRLPATGLVDALFENAAVGLAVWDLELRFQRVSPRLAALDGVPAEAHVGRRPSEVLPELGPRLEEVLRAVLASAGPVRDVEVEGAVPAAPGVSRRWLLHCFPVHDDHGRAAGLAGLIMEVTRERDVALRADSALQRSAFVDAELRALYSALPVGVAFLSPDLRYQRVNETLARMNGRPVDAHLGASLEEILGEHAPMLRAALTDVMQRRRAVELELSAALPHEPADVRALEATYFPVVDGGGELLGVGGVVRDVTDRHRLELEESRLLREALLARAQAEAAGVRTDDAREEAERARAEAELEAIMARVRREAGRTPEEAQPATGSQQE